MINFFLFVEDVCWCHELTVFSMSPSKLRPNQASDSSESNAIDNLPNLPRFFLIERVVRPIDHEGLPLNIVHRHGTPCPTVTALIPIIPHCKNITFWYFKWPAVWKRHMETDSARAYRAQKRCYSANGRACGREGNRTDCQWRGIHVLCKHYLRLLPR